MMLFSEVVAKLRQSELSGEMNASYLVEKALQFVEQYPSVSLGYQDFNNNMLAVERLTAMGYEVEYLNTYATAYPETPVAPKRKNTTLRGIRGGIQGVEAGFAATMKKCKSIHERTDTGELTFISAFGQKEITLCYIAKCYRQCGRMAITTFPVLEKWNSRTNVTRK